MYLPMLTNAHPVRRYLIGQQYLVIVLTDCESDGEIQYQYVVIVYQLPPDANPDKLPKPVMAVAAETDDMVSEPDAYFLGVFPGEGHLNLGLSADWGDLGKFTAKALEIVAEHLQIAQAPLPLPEDKGRPS